jgi:hypothetical protein
MIIWIAIGLIFTGSINFYCLRKGFERHEQYKAVAASLLATACGAFGISIIPDFQSRPVSVEQPYRAASEVFIDPEAQPTQELATRNGSVIEKDAAKLPSLKWVKLKDKNYNITNKQSFGYLSASKLAIYSSEFVNKIDKTVVGVELQITVRNCGHAGGNRKNCPIESGPHTRKVTEIVIKPHQSSEIAAKVPIIGNPEHYLLGISLKRVAYFEGALTKEMELRASNEANSIDNIPSSNVDLTPTCGAGGMHNTKPSRSDGVVEAALANKPIEHRC